MVLCASPKLAERQDCVLCAFKWTEVPRIHNRVRNNHVVRSSVQQERQPILRVRRIEGAAAAPPEPDGEPDDEPDDEPDNEPNSEDADDGPDKNEPDGEPHDASHDQSFFNANPGLNNFN